MRPCRTSRGGAGRRHRRPVAPDHRVRRRGRRAHPGAGGAASRSRGRPGGRGSRGGVGPAGGLSRGDAARAGARLLRRSGQRASGRRSGTRRRRIRSPVPSCSLRRPGRRAHSTAATSSPPRPPRCAGVSLSVTSGAAIDPGSLVRLAPPPVACGALADGRRFLRAEVVWVDRFGNVQLGATFADAEEAQVPTRARARAQHGHADLQCRPDGHRACASPPSRRDLRRVGVAASSGCCSMRMAISPWSPAKPRLPHCSPSAWVTRSQLTW